MECFDKFKKKMNRNGGNLRNENIRNSKQLITATFEDDASFALGIYRWELGLTDYTERETIGLRLYKRSYSNANGVTVKFQSLIDTPIVVGDVVYDSVADEYLICTESFNIDGIHWQGKFTLCNWMLRWQIKATGEIVEYPCYNANTTQYNSGETSNKQYTVSSSQHTLTLPYDENTVVLDSPQRFYLDRNTKNPITFIVTQNDTTSAFFGKKGIVRVTVVEYAKDAERDRPDLGICDYMDESYYTHSVSDGDVKKAEIVYTDNIIISGGDTQIFTGKFFDDDGNEIQNAICSWQIISAFTDKLFIKEFDNQIEIGIDDDTYIDEEFKLVLKDAEGNGLTSLIIKIESLL